MEKIEKRMEDLDMWAREGSEVMGRGWVFCETSHRKGGVSSLVSPGEGGHEVTGPIDEVKCSIDIAGFAGLIVEF
jgi:hypothetical protein